MDVNMVKMDDIYVDLKKLVEKTHSVLVLEQNQINQKNQKNEKNQTNQINQNIKLNIQKTQACQTTTTKPTTIQTHIYVSRPAAGRSGTRTDPSIINWSHSLRRSYFF